MRMLRAWPLAALASMTQAMPNKQSAKGTRSPVWTISAMAVRSVDKVVTVVTAAEVFDQARTELSIRKATRMVAVAGGGRA